jgi:hypothetical protein
MEIMVRIIGALVALPILVIGTSVLINPAGTAALFGGTPVFDSLGLDTSAGVLGSYLVTISLFAIIGAIGRMWIAFAIAAVMVWLDLGTRGLVNLDAHPHTNRSVRGLDVVRVLPLQETCGACFQYHSDRLNPGSQCPSASDSSSPREGAFRPQKTPTRHRS